MTPAGFPHSDIHGSQIASISPWLFAGSRVLHRRLVPRHSPCALSTLTCSAHAGSVCASGAVIPMVCGLKPEVPFGNPRLSYIHSARHIAFGTNSDPSGFRRLESDPRPARPHGRARVTTGFSCSSFSKFFSCQIAALAGRKSCRLFRSRRTESSMEDTGIEPVTSSLQSWRSPS